MSLSMFRVRFKLRRNYSSFSSSGMRTFTTGLKLIYNEYGDPCKIITLEKYDVGKDLANSEVLVEMLAAPVNPADINTMQGTYAIKPPLPSIPGNEGVGRIIGVGEHVKGLEEGDWVVPKRNAWGTFRTHAVAPESDFIKIFRDLDVALAATLMVNPATAYRMLHDFVVLKSGDSVIQNGGNSHVGQCVSQICTKLDVKCVSVVRDRDNIQELKAQLQEAGADLVLTEKELRTTDAFKSGSIPSPVLGLNCVGGRNATELLRHLANNCTLVTYGGMSREPIPLGVAPLVFKDISLRGFWMTRWNQENLESEERGKMVEFLVEMAKEGSLKPPPHCMLPLSDFQKAFESSMAGFGGKKQIFKLSL